MKEKGLIMIFSFISITIILGHYATASIYSLENGKIDNNLIPLLIPPYKSVSDSANMTKFHNSSLVFVSNIK
ncbi:MAG: hypothetical protein M3162_05580 [Thermoproteota archaeon]|nr:hypothetical protein [Thermoproteota archaeon]